MGGREWEDAKSSPTVLYGLNKVPQPGIVGRLHQNCARRLWSPALAIEKKSREPGTEFLGTPIKEPVDCCWLLKKE